MTTFFYSAEPEGRPLGLIALLLLQLAPCAIVFGIWHLMYTWDKPTLDARIKSMGPRHLESMKLTLAEIQPSRALREEDRPNVETFIETLSKDSNWELSQVKSRQSLSTGLIEPVIYSFTIRGDPYDLPVFIDGLHRTRSIASIEELALRMEGPKMARVVFKIQFIRPSVPDDDWLSQLNEEEMHAEILRLGWQCWVWRAYLEKESSVVERVDSLRIQLQQDLPKVLIAFRRGEGNFIWKPDAGLSIL